MRNNLSTILILFLFAPLILSLPIFAAPTPKLEVDINPIVFKLLQAKSKEEKEKLKGLIESNINDAYYQAFQEFDKKKGLIKNEAGKDLKCIIDAVDSYRNRFASQPVYIHFTFDDMYKE